MDFRVRRCYKTQRKPFTTALVFSAVNPAKAAASKSSALTNRGSNFSFAFSKKRSTTIADQPQHLEHQQAPSRKERRNTYCHARPSRASRSTHLYTVTPWRHRQFANVPGREDGDGRLVQRAYSSFCLQSRSFTAAKAWGLRWDGGT